MFLCLSVGTDRKITLLHWHQIEYEPLLCLKGLQRKQCMCQCRVRDTCIVVAMEEMPDEGLDQPLRLDKLANEVESYHSPCCPCLAICWTES